MSCDVISLIAADTIRSEKGIVSHRRAQVLTVNQSPRSAERLDGLLVSQSEQPMGGISGLSVGGESTLK